MTRGSERVHADRAGTRATVTWSRPPLNVLDIETLQELTETLRTDAVRSAHVVILRGAGRCWSAGFSVEDHLAKRVRSMFNALRDLLGALGAIPSPIIAQVDGPCLGGGLELLSACDLAIASASATFGQPEIRLGVFPPLAAAEMPRALGPKRAAELLLLGETVGAARAWATGIVSRVVPDSALEQEVDWAAGKLQGYRYETLVLLKRVMRGELPDRSSRLASAERVYLEELMRLPHAEEGLLAFLEKRTPVWPASGD